MGLIPKKTGGKRIEYFVIVQSEGDSMYISIVYICDENAFAFCVTLPFICAMVLHSVFSVLIIYICVFIFSFLILSLSFLVFYFLYLSFLSIARFITFVVH